ncbi:hypothetical protein QQA44_03640 [Sneathia vaginalis]|uniref:hypothetical protein n=1 Tax=Sneathia vaginalis TaxID=187101 RepID=UPI00254DEDDE|nr:hypothetical protein [Sneathia vaginalis]MDK9581931.1 hypothetical protein [Sneathia vaginalis]
MKLGNLEEVTKKANGQDPYVWARNFVDDLNKKEKEKNKEVLIPLSTGKLVEIDKKILLILVTFFLRIFSIR